MTANPFPWRLRAAWWLSARVTPWLCSSQHSYFEHVEKLIRPQNRILDIGCGKEFLMSWLRPDLYQRWSASIVDRTTIFGVDPFLPSLSQNASPRTACAFAEHLPFSASSFDLVMANMVVEHLPDPDAVLREVFRVLQPGGAFLFHTPNLQAPPIMVSNVLPHSIKRLLVPLLEGGRSEEDVFPTHYRLNTGREITSAAERSGFHVEWIQPVFSVPWTQMMGPLVLMELLAIRAMRGERFAAWRPDLICLLRKPPVMSSAN